MDSPYPIASKRQTNISLLGLPIHEVDRDGVHEFIQGVIESKQKALVLNLNVNCANLARKRLWLRDFLRTSQLTFCDGDGIRWGLRCLGYRPPPKITYDRWIWELAEFCEKRSLSLYFLGAKPGVAEKAAEQLQKRFPKLQIAGTQHGYFEKKGAVNDKVIAEINRVSPDILVLGFGMPLQEQWLRDHWISIKAHIFLTGGAVFDYASGLAKRAPHWMIQCHLEWLYRLSEEPGRLFVRYVFGIPYFFFCVFMEKLGR